MLKKDFKATYAGFGNIQNLGEMVISWKSGNSGNNDIFIEKSDNLRFHT